MFFKVFPLECYKRYTKIKQDLISNGRKFMSLRNINHYKYKGTVFFWTKDGLLRFSTSSRIIVDMIAFYYQNPNYSKQLIAINIYKINVIN